MTGGKTHLSETNLARLMIRILTPNDTFVDVGAHYGYFSLLASQLVGKNGHVLAFEASSKTFSILKKNQVDVSNFIACNYAVSNSDELLTFYEFPNLYSEYNSFDIDQYKNELWFEGNRPNEIKINSVRLDDYFTEYKLASAMIKIDVAGAEYNVDSGMANYLLSNSPLVIMEYLNDERGNIAHKKAEAFMTDLGYAAHQVGSNGELLHLENVSQYLDESQIDSDNIVFKKIN